MSKVHMSARDRFFEELQRAIARGFTLAAVSVAMSCGSPSVGDAGSGGDAGGGGGSQGVRDSDGGGLAQVSGGAFFCSGDAGYTGPYYGSCCTNLHCYQPTDSACSTSANISPFAMTFTPPLPPGSGTCLCGSPAVTGPFAQPDGGTTECCYVVGSIGCTGRPLRDGETAIVAPVVVRSDWA